MAAVLGLQGDGGAGVRLRGASCSPLRVPRKTMAAVWPGMVNRCLAAVRGSVRVQPGHGLEGDVHVRRGEQGAHHHRLGGDLVAGLLEIAGQGGEAGERRGRRTAGGVSSAILPEGTGPAAEHISPAREGWGAGRLAVSSRPRAKPPRPLRRPPLPQAARLLAPAGRLFGAILGLLVYSASRARSSRGRPRPSTLLARPAAWLRGLGARHLRLARARAGRRAPARSDRGGGGGLDDETLAEARQNEHPGIASYPWPREIIGGMTRPARGGGRRSSCCSTCSSPS